MADSKFGKAGAVKRMITIKFGWPDESYPKARVVSKG